jgi:predicted nucleic acid-binding protein
LTVTDAGVWIRAIVDEEPGGPVRTRLGEETSVASPALIDLELTNVLRGLVAKGLIGPRHAERALSEFMQAPIQRYGHLALLQRIWRLRANLTVYDASYIALAELLAGDFLTIDTRLAGVPGIRCPVEVL